MKKSYKWTLVVILALLVVVALALVACTPDNTDDDDVWTIERVYAQAQELGYQGTLDELIAQFKGADGTDGVDGKDGVGIKTMEVNDDGELIVTLTNGTELNLGVIVGATGPQGPQGPQGATGPQGPQGPSGQDGKPSVHTFTVTFVAEGREVGKVVCLDGTTFAPEPAVPQKEYYTGKWESYTLNNVDITVQAVYTPTQYKVTFAGNGQQEVRTYTVETVDEVTAPEVPEKEHYTGAWQEYELQFDNNQVVNAVYTPIEYKITFVGNEQRIERTYNVETASQFVAPDVPAKEYYGFECAGKWEQFYFKYDDQQVVNAVYEVITPGYTYILNSDKQSYSLTNVSKGFENAIVLPYYNDLPVTSIGDSAFEGCRNLQTVMIGGESQLQSINDRAFYNCGSLTEITIPNTVTNMGNSAFCDCTRLQTVTFEDDSQLQDIGSEAFSCCSNLMSVIIPSTVTSICNSVFYGCTNLQTVTFEGESQLQSIGNSAFYDCRSLTSIIIPSTVTYIGYLIFSGCSNLTIYCEATKQPSSWNVGWNSNRPVVWNYYDITKVDGVVYALHPDNTATVVNTTDEVLTQVTISQTIDFDEKQFTVTSIGDSAFSGCSSLTSITIPSTVTSIGNYVFNNCSSLTSITIPSTVTSIDNSAFHGCTSLQTIMFDGDSQLQSIGEDAFNGCSSLTSIIIPSTVISIDYGAFYDCTNLQTVTFEDDSQLQGIGSYAFFNCSSLTSITIPSNVTSIGISAFSNCTNLQTVTFEGDSQLQNIGAGTFCNCSNLTSITIPSTVTSIGSYAFSVCSQLTIYCEVANEPNGWDSDWNPSNRPVEWGYKQQ